jgi:hypothetical protein
MAKSDCCSKTHFTMRAKCQYQAVQEERLGVVFGGDSTAEGTSMAQVLVNDQVVVPNGAPPGTPCGDKKTGQGCPTVLWSEPVHPDGEEKTVTVVFSTSQQAPRVHLVAAPTQQCFEGQFTVDTDKIKMVNICIGLWAKTAAEIRSGKELSPIAQLIFDKRDEVFPKEYFFKLTDVLNDVLANPDEQIDDLIKMMGQRSANAVTKVSADVIMKKMDTDGDGKVSEEEFNEYVALHGSSTIRSMVEQGRGLGISES